MSTRYFAMIRIALLSGVLIGLLASGGVTPAMAQSVIPQGQMSVVSASSDEANKEAVLDGNSTTKWTAVGSPPHEMIMALGGNYLVSEFRYTPFIYTKCTQYEVYVSPTNGSWGNAVAAGTWANTSAEKTAIFASPKPGAFVRVRYLNPYCYAAEHNVVGVAEGGGGGGPAAHEALATEHANLATQIEAVPTTAAMSAQHDMIQQDISAVQTAIDEVKALVEALPGGSGPCDVPPVWGKKFPGDERFLAVLDGAAYCDQETGMVWDGAPVVDPIFTWSNAISHCANREVGGRKGWQLPTREQLASLLDSSSALCEGGGPCLPDGHPFDNVQAAPYRSSTTTAELPTHAWVVEFLNSFRGPGDVNFNTKTSRFRAWCTRGGQSYDGQDLNAVVPN